MRLSNLRKRTAKRWHLFREQAGWWKTVHGIVSSWMLSRASNMASGGNVLQNCYLSVSLLFCRRTTTKSSNQASFKTNISETSPGCPSHIWSCLPLPQSLPAGRIHVCSFWDWRRGSPNILDHSSDRTVCVVAETRSWCVGLFSNHKVCIKPLWASPVKMPACVAWGQHSSQRGQVLSEIGVDPFMRFFSVFAPACPKCSCLPFLSFPDFVVAYKKMIWPNKVSSDYFQSCQPVVKCSANLARLKAWFSIPSLSGLWMVLYGWDSRIPDVFPVATVTAENTCEDPCQNSLERKFHPQQHNCVVLCLDHADDSLRTFGHPTSWNLFCLSLIGSHKSFLWALV